MTDDLHDAAASELMQRGAGGLDPRQFTDMECRLADALRAEFDPIDLHAEIEDISSAEARALIDALLADLGPTAVLASQLADEITSELDAAGSEPSATDAPQVLTPLACLPLGRKPIESISVASTDTEAIGSRPRKNRQGSKEARKEASEAVSPDLLEKSLAPEFKDYAMAGVDAAEGVNGAGATDIISVAPSAAASVAASSEPQPLELSDLWHVEFQLWRNKTPGKSRKAEWTLKLRATRHSKPYSTPDEFFVGFHMSRRRQRNAVRRYAKEGKIGPQWSTEILHLIAAQPEDNWLGLFSTPNFHAPNKRASSNARDIADGCWATMSLNADASAPRLIILRIGDDELVIDTFHRSNATKPNGPGWIALYDPDKLHTTKREMARINETQRRGQQVRAHEVTTKLGNAILADRYKMADLERKIADHEQRYAALERQYGELRDHILDLTRRA